MQSENLLAWGDGDGDGRGGEESGEEFEGEECTSKYGVGIFPAKMQCRRFGGSKKFRPPSIHPNLRRNSNVSNQQISRANHTNVSNCYISLTNLDSRGCAPLNILAKDVDVPLGLVRHRRVVPEMGGINTRQQKRSKGPHRLMLPCPIAVTFS